MLILCIIWQNLVDVCWYPRINDLSQLFNGRNSVCILAAVVYWCRENTPVKTDGDFTWIFQHKAEKRRENKLICNNLKLGGVLIRVSPTKGIANYKLVPPKQTSKYDFYVLERVLVHSSKQSKKWPKKRVYNLKSRVLIHDLRYSNADIKANTRLRTLTTFTWFDPTRLVHNFKINNS